MCAVSVPSFPLGTFRVSERNDVSSKGDPTSISSRNGWSCRSVVTKQEIFTQDSKSLSEGNQNSLGTVYRCEITSIDDQPTNGCPPLCLKLFGDRFQSLSMPEPTPKFGFKRVDGELQEYSIRDKRDPTEILHHLYYGMLFAESGALMENFVYEKLQFVQGSIVPWFYGAHQVRCILEE